jgi:hypothetical protein
MTVIITPEEARNLANNNYHTSEMLKDFFRFVRNASESGDTSGNFYTGGKHFDESEYTKIMKLGYKLYWNSPCLWYEVDWSE